MFWPVRYRTASRSVFDGIKSAIKADRPAFLLESAEQGQRVGLPDFDPCTILLNNDLTAGPPGILEDLHEQYLLPPLHHIASGPSGLTYHPGVTLLPASFVTPSTALEPISF